MRYKNSRAPFIGTILVIVVLGSGIYISHQKIMEGGEAVLESWRNQEPTIEIVGLSLLPPSADLEIIYTIDNPSEHSFTLIIDASLFINDKFIDNIDVEQEVRANGRTPVIIDLHLGGSIIAEMTDPDAEYEIEGKKSLTTKMFGLIPITITEDY